MIRSYFHDYYIKTICNILSPAVLPIPDDIMEARFKGFVTKQINLIAENIKYFQSDIKITIFFRQSKGDNRIGIEGVRVGSV